MNYGQQMNMDYFNIQPSMVKGRANIGVAYEKRYLWNLIYSKFRFTLPKEWEVNFFRFWLFQAGSIGVIYTKEYGWICNPYGIIKRALYYKPSEIEVYNEWLKAPKRGIIGINAGIIHCMDDYFGLDDLVTRYAEKLSQIDRSIDVNLMNCNVTAFFQASNKKQADTIKEAYGRASSGEPLIVVNRDVMQGEMLQPFLQHVANTYIVDKLQVEKRMVINEFLTKVGIKNANYDKKERLNSQEVEANDEEVESIVSIILENIRAGMEEINAISGLGLSVELTDFNGGEENEIDALRNDTI